MRTRPPATLGRIGTLLNHERELLHFHGRRRTFLLEDMSDVAIRACVPRCSHRLSLGEVTPGGTTGLATTAANLAVRRYPGCIVGCVHGIMRSYSVLWRLDRSAWRRRNVCAAQKVVYDHSSHTARRRYAQDAAHRWGCPVADTSHSRTAQARYNRILSPGSQRGAPSCSASAPALEYQVYPVPCDSEEDFFASLNTPPASLRDVFVLRSRWLIDSRLLRQLIEGPTPRWLSSPGAASESPAAARLRRATNRANEQTETLTTLATWLSDLNDSIPLQSRPIVQPTVARCRVLHAGDRYS